jgi:uncharacterized membrane protein YeaQ/YmgE (transglycosylase-associated protein family)
MHLLVIIFIGLISGWIVGVLTRGHGFGLLGNIVVGIVGSIVGGFVFGLTGLVAITWIGDICRSVVGALALLFVFRLFAPKGRA